MTELLNLRVDQMAGVKFDCSCGMRHQIDIKNILVGYDVIKDLPLLLKEYKNSKIFIFGDENTFNAAGYKVEEILKNEFSINKHIFYDEHLVPDERALGRLLVKIEPDIRLIIAVGSGTINDLARYVSFKLGIPYVIVGTAPSMDGYASMVSPLITEGVKTTYSAVYPLAIVADLNIMKDAPMNMLHAGLGDILGKYTALADWRISNILNREYFCGDIEKLMLKVINKCVGAAPFIKNREGSIIESISEALILSGLAIGMVGASRPASGEEHHLSHCWEMMFLNSGDKDKWLHGNYVGVSVGIIIEAYKYLNEIKIEDIYNSESYLEFDRNKWEANIKDVYGRIGNNIIEYKQDAIIFDMKERKRNIEKIASRWNEIKNICSACLPDSSYVRDILKNTGAIYKPGELGLDRDTFKKSFIAAKDIRRRYGILQLLEDIGKLEDAAEYIAGLYY